MLFSLKELKKFCPTSCCIFFYKGSCTIMLSFGIFDKCKIQNFLSYYQRNIAAMYYKVKWVLAEVWRIADIVVSSVCILVYAVVRIYTYTLMKVVL